ncbi:MAG: hypothetical protein JST82_07870 [Bacteroidetes bacterium]|nr:hypothetical protein [Bacteroidota bacterium]
MDNALLEQLKTKAGLTEEQAVKAMQTMIEFIKSKVPPMMHGMIDNFLDDGESVTDKMKNVANTAKENMEDFAKEAGDKMGDFAHKAQDAAKDALDKLNEFMKKK